MSVDQNDKIELLTFLLADQTYALDIAMVREIREWRDATPLPHAPDHMKGVINLRGTVLPVMDLQIRVGLPQRAQSRRRVVIVVHFDECAVGLLVDAVSDIITVARGDLQPAPDGPPVRRTPSAPCRRDGSRT